MECQLSQIYMVKYTNNTDTLIWFLVLKLEILPVVFPYTDTCTIISIILITNHTHFQQFWIFTCVFGKWKYRTIMLYYSESLILVFAFPCKYIF